MSSGPLILSRKSFLAIGLSPRPVPCMRFIALTLSTFFFFHASNLNRNPKCVGLRELALSWTRAATFRSFVRRETVQPVDLQFAKGD